MTAKLPWLIGAGGSMVYLVTLNHWVSLQSLGTVARLSGWLWQPELRQPLTWVVLAPFRVLPASWIPLALNLFTAGCAGGVLALLARTVALLPHTQAPDRPFGPRPSDPILTTPSAWMPPVLAAMVCGLQLSFWEHATAGTGEMIDLLVVAYVVRCLAEFRLDQAQGWLWRAACVYAAGMTNNWLLAGAFPIFLAAIFWLKGLGGVYDARFLLRMALWGLAGLSLYALLPAAALTPDGHMNFWTALKANLRFQAGSLNAVRTPAFRVLCLLSLLALLILAIRWKSHTVQFGDDSRLGVFLIKATGHVAHLAFFGVAFWLALDPRLGPHPGNPGAPRLICYYLSAVTVGHCAGYLLLFGLGNRQRRAMRLAVAAMWVLLAGVPVVLGWRSLEQILMTNGPELRQFARSLYADLPSGKSAVLCDHQTDRMLLQVEAASRGRDKDLLVLDARALASAQYQRLMARRWPTRWPIPPPTNRVEVVRPVRLLALLHEFASKESLVYVRPEFGFPFERFNAFPVGLVHYLEPREAGDGRTSQSAQARAATNARRWPEAWSQGLQAFAHYRKENSKASSSGAHSVLEALRLNAEPNPTADFLGAAYSRALDSLGVNLQRGGDWPAAGLWFGRALELNPENVAARLNERYNARYQQGERARLDGAKIQKEFSDQLAAQGNWGEVLNANGPVDEPSLLFRTGRELLAAGNPQQAADVFTRCSELASDWPMPRLWLAQCRVQTREFAAALALTDGVPAASFTEGAPLSRLFFCRAAALHGLGRTNECETFVADFLKDYRSHVEVLTAAADFYSESGQYEAEVGVLDELLSPDAHQPGLLSRKGLAEMGLGRYEAAIVSLTAALTLAPADEIARLRRAAAYLGAGKLEPARADYTLMLKTADNSENALFGLGTVAWRERNTNAAVDFYEQYLARGGAEARQNTLAAERLRELKNSRPK